MQILCKPPRRVYDTKAIEACHNEKDGLDLHDVKHGCTVAAIGAAATAATANPVVGAGVALVVWASEAEEQITHALEEAGNAIADAAEDVWDWATENSGSSSAGSIPPSGSNNGGYYGGTCNDPYADDHNNAQAGSY